MNYAKGIDCSHWQDNVPWQQLWDDGFRFVYMKVSEGIWYEDIRWRQHYADAKSFGFLVGPYHWFSPGVSGTLQAEYMHSLINDVEWDMPYCLDQEEPANMSTASYAARVRSFVYRAQELSTRKVTIYTSLSKWKYTGNMIIDAYFWVANWTTRPQPTMPINVSSWKYWQYRGAPLDLDRFNGTYEDLLKFCDVVPPPPPNNDFEQRLSNVERLVVKIGDWIRGYE